MCKYLKIMLFYSKKQTFCPPPQKAQGYEQLQTWLQTYVLVDTRSL